VILQLVDLFHDGFRVDVRSVCELLRPANDALFVDDYYRSIRGSPLRIIETVRL